MGQVVVVAFRPKTGAEGRLLALLREHVPILRSEGLATSRDPLILKAGDGTLLEIFEWASAEAIEAAHSNPVVQALWPRFAEVCDYVPLAQLDETQGLFATFEPLPPES
jgi:quinol monooxygenase YgiN